jgi:hypothetical protein
VMVPAYERVACLYGDCPARHRDGTLHRPDYHHALPDARQALIGRSQRLDDADWERLKHVSRNGLLTPCPYGV